MNIMHVEDNLIFAGLMKTLLSFGSHTVKSFSKASEAWEEYLIHGREYDVVIVDYHLEEKDMNGEWLLRRIKEGAPKPCILLTESDAHVDNKFFDVRMDKIFFPEDLLKVIVWLKEAYDNEYKHYRENFKESCKKDYHVA